MDVRLLGLATGITVALAVVMNALPADATGSVPSKANHDNSQALGLSIGLAS
ncbi:MAG: hypothetical protein AAFY20_06525 [Cyanobacteria bacterium J06639_14]